jgi:ubiquinone/menaquinone biosynthesis C-methylase UbiE
MKTFKRYYLPVAFVTSLALLTACRSPQIAGQGAIPHEPSAKPGINTELLKPDLNVSNWVERFEKEGREIYDHRAKIVAAAKIKPGIAVGDIGAGTGLFTPLLAEAVGPRGKVYAVDIVPKFLEHIRERAARAGLKSVETILCTDRSVELPASSIDLAFICDVYHHFEYPRSSLASLHRALRPGGEIFLVDFKRIPGVSSDWVMNHVRAGEDVVTAEIEAAGFRKIETLDLLKDNYVLRFQKK